MFYNIFPGEIDLGEIEVVEELEDKYEKSDQPESFTTVIKINENDETKNLAEVLSECSEIFIKDTGGEAGVSTVSIRGSSSKNVLIMIDGTPVNTAGNSSFDISMIPASSVGKIEIIRGGEAALYGPGAMGGVINIVTKKSYQNFTKYTISSIFNRSLQNIISTGFIVDFFDLFCSYEYKYDQGDFEYFDNNGTEFNEDDDTLGNRKHNSAEKTSFLLKQNFFLPRQIKTGYSFYYNEKNNEIAGPLTFENHFKNAYLSSRLLNIGYNLGLGNISPYFTGDFFINYKNDSYQYSNPQEYGGSSYESERSLNYIRHKAQFQLFAVPYNIISIIGEISYEKMDEFNFEEFSSQKKLIQPERLEASVILRDEFLIVDERIGIVPTLRFQYNSDLEEKFHFLWNAGLFFKPFKGFKIKLNGFHAFRNPDFNEMYYSYGQYVGNPDLKPEISYGGDAGLHYEHKLFFLEFVLFCTYYKDLIMYLLSYGFVYKPMNIGNSLSFGGECRLHLHIIKNLNVQFSYTINYLNDLDVLKKGILRQLPGQPFQTLVSNIEINLPFKNLINNISAQFKFEDSILITNSASKFIPPKLNIDAAWKFTIKDIKILNFKSLAYSFFFNANNILNIHTTDIRNYPLEGFSLEIGSSIAF